MRYGLPARGTGCAVLCVDGVDGFVASTAAPTATGWSEPVAGWELHPLKSPLKTSRDCVIWAHAGHVPDDDRFNGTFKVDGYFILHFHTIHAQANVSSPEETLAERPDDDAVSFNFEAPRMDWQPGVRDFKKKGLDQKVESVDPKMNLKIRKFTTSSYTETKTWGADMERGRSVLRETTLNKTARNFRKANMLLRGQDPLEGQVFKGMGDECYNYVVKNGLGIHWAPKLGTGTPYGVADILQLQDELLQKRAALGDGATEAELKKAWVPHVVYVPSDRVVMLKDRLRIVWSHVRLKEKISGRSMTSTSPAAAAFMWDGARRPKIEGGRNGCILQSGTEMKKMVSGGRQSRPLKCTTGIEPVRKSIVDRKTGR